MAKKKTYVEELLSDFRKSQKLAREAVSSLEARISSREKRIKFLEERISVLEEELGYQKECYENRFQEIFGVNFDNYLIGYGFEKHVVWWMNQYQKGYELKIWQGDKLARPYEEDDSIYASWNKYPDLIYVNERQKKVVALECKYRYDGVLNIDRRKYEDYKHFEMQIGSLMNVDTRVFIMVGSRGTADKPDFMYCIPVDYFENLTEVDLRSVPQFKIMERDYYYGNINNLPENFMF